MVWCFCFHRRDLDAESCPELACFHFDGFGISSGIRLFSGRGADPAVLFNWRRRGRPDGLQATAAYLAVPTDDLRLDTGGADLLRPSQCLADSVAFLPDGNRAVLWRNGLPVADSDFGSKKRHLECDCAELNPVQPGTHRWSCLGRTCVYSAG